MEPKSILEDKLCKSSYIGVYVRIPLTKRGIDLNKKFKFSNPLGTSIRFLGSHTPSGWVPPTCSSLCNSEWYAVYA